MPGQSDGGGAKRPSGGASGSSSLSLALGALMMLLIGVNLGKMLAGSSRDQDRPATRVSFDVVGGRGEVKYAPVQSFGPSICR